MVGGVAAISTSAVLIRLAEAPPRSLPFIACFSALFFLPFGLKQWRSQKLTKSQLSLALGAGIMLALHFLFG